MAAPDSADGMELSSESVTEEEKEIIIFYEDRDFKGHSYECSGDSSDLLSFFNRCGSIRVEHGNWMVYEFPNYRGCQLFLKRGEYPDFNQCMGFGDTIRSCRIIPQQGSCKIKVYEREDFKGQMMEFTEDCPQVFEKFRYHDIHSCNVLEGHWIFYDEPNYKGRQYYLRPGEYRRYSDWGGLNSKVGSFRRAIDFH
ncbi:gamma-crystallin 1-like [Bombina bombina]|uniref:gamma-crystallin 1-like n=1 Tax=Bombina bombina TaxID=8345 RepID=UPI00235B2284|nr:gamma-crystallin 1-like [Bombina bombina]